MKLWETLRFEAAYQARRVQTWLFSAFLGIVAFASVEANFLADAQDGAYVLNAPYVIASATAIAVLFWLLVAGAVTGEAAARDVQTRMHPLTYTAPRGKAAYLWGRFLAAFGVNGGVLLAVPLGIALGGHIYGGEEGLLGPTQPAAYLSAYGLVALPSAFIVTAFQFACAALTRRVMASYLASVLLLVVAFLVAGNGSPLLDPVGVVAVPAYLDGWTPSEKNTRLVGLEGPLLWNRLLWLAVALSVLIGTTFRFRFRHRAETSWLRHLWRRREAASTPMPRRPVTTAPVSAPQVRPAFDVRTRTHQTLAVAQTSFAATAKSRGGLFLLALVAALAFLSATGSLVHMGVPLIPRTDYVLRSLTVPEAPPAWVIVPLLLVFFAGELVWREREAGLGEVVDAAPVPDGVLVLGKLVALALALALCMALWMTAGLFAQASAGYFAFEIGRYLQILFGIQFVEYFLFGLLAFAIHVVVDQKYVGHLAAVAAFVLLAVASENGAGHRVLVYGSAPEAAYTDLRGLVGLGPWLWFTLYWGAWAILLAVMARLLWVRGRAPGFGARLRAARRRVTRPTAVTAAVALAFALVLGGSVAYQSAALSEPGAAAERIEQAAEYERRYGPYEGAPQPRMTGTRLHVELYPERRAAEIRGTYHLVNRGGALVDSVHVATAPGVETGDVTFDRAAAPVLIDDRLGHRIYALEQPLQPGDSLRLHFEVHVEPRFRPDGVPPSAAAVAANGTYFTNEDWLPQIGYRPGRQIAGAAERRAHGLSPRTLVRSLYDADARRDATGRASTAFEAIVGTDEDQLPVAPGGPKRAWTERGRRYVHYATDAPIGNEYAILSADYAVHESHWEPSDGRGHSVEIRIFHHPEHTAPLERMIHAATAALDHYTAWFGPYPYGHLTFAERPGHGRGMHAEASMVTYAEGFSLLNPEADPQAPDLVFSVAAHEVAHQWWGSYLGPARMEGTPFLSESLAQYAAMRVVEEALGAAHLRRLLQSQRRADAETQQSRAAAPLLRATDRYAVYRKGPLAMHALGEYVGEDRVDRALRGVLMQHASGSLVTTLDLYRELQTVTPDSLQTLLHDLFEANTFWELEAEHAAAERTPGGPWRVTLEVEARKVVVDEAGAETEVPMDDWVEVGLYGAQKARGAPLYRRWHRVRSGEQTIAVTVPERPARAGIDPRGLLFDVNLDDNVTDVAR